MERLRKEGVVRFELAWCGEIITEKYAVDQVSSEFSDFGGAYKTVEEVGWGLVVLILQKKFWSITNVRLMVLIG